MSTVDVDVTRLALLDQIELPGAQRVPRIVAVNTPAAGGEWSFPVPGGVIWELQSAIFTVVTSATVINRFPGLTAVGDGVTLYWDTFPNPQAASLTDIYNFAPTRGALTGATTAAVFGLSCPAIPLLPSWTLGSRTVNLQVGDQLQAISLYVVERRPPVPGSTFSP